jgi:hypothetical protein
MRQLFFERLLKSHQKTNSSTKKSHHSMEIKKTKEIETLVKDWTIQLKEALKTGLNETNTHLLQCPSQVLLDFTNQKIPQPHPFQTWETSCLIEFKGVKYLKLLKTSGKKGPSEKPLAIIRSHTDPNHRRSRKLEEKCLTLLYENPSQHNILSKRGNIVSKFIGRPAIQADQEPAPLETLKGNQQEYITLLGKKGIAAFHTGHQYCHLHQPLNGEFQRFFIGPTPHSALIRAAHTLGKLADAEPKSIAETTTTLINRFNQSLVPFAERILGILEHRILDYYPYNHQNDAQSFGESLPKILLKKGAHRIYLSLCSDRANPYNFQRCAISLKTDHPSTDSQFNKEGFLTIWKNLQKK